MYSWSNFGVYQNQSLLKNTLCSVTHLPNVQIWWDPGIYVFSKLPAESNAHQNLRTTVAGNRTLSGLKKKNACSSSEENGSKGEGDQETSKVAVMVI